MIVGVSCLLCSSAVPGVWSFLRVTQTGTSQCLRDDDIPLMNLCPSQPRQMLHSLQSLSKQKKPPYACYTTRRCTSFRKHACPSHGHTPAPSHLLAWTSTRGTRSRHTFSCAPVWSERPDSAVGGRPTCNKHFATTGSPCRLHRCRTAHAVTKVGVVAVPRLDLVDSHHGLLVALHYSPG